MTSSGEVLVSVGEAQIHAAVTEPRGNGVEAMAVCYLWSFRDGSNERRGALLTSEYPELFVTPSSELQSGVGRELAQDSRSSSVILAKRSVNIVPPRGRQHPTGAK